MHLLFDDTWPHDFAGGYTIPSDKAPKGVTFLAEDGVSYLMHRGLFMNQSSFELTPIANVFPPERWHFSIIYYEFGLAGNLVPDNRVLVRFSDNTDAATANIAIN